VTLITPSIPHLINFESSFFEACLLGWKNFKEEISLLAQRVKGKRSQSRIFGVMLIFSWCTLLGEISSVHLGTSDPYFLKENFATCTSEYPNILDLRIF
jgi:hypothetical protein